MSSEVACSFAKRASLTFLLGLIFASAEAKQCRSLFEKPSAVVKVRAPRDLFDFYKKDIQWLSARTVRQLNKETLNQVEALVPTSDGTRAKSLSFSDASKVLNSLINHPVASPDHKQNYEGNGEIGYCFGRAAYVHLLLLKMGLQKDSIRKIWAIGPIRTDQEGQLWRYHVATMAYTRDLGWVTIDSTQMKPEPLRHWMSFFSSRSDDGLLRFYVSEPEKFAPNVGKYDRVQLGLDLAKESDWYQHYFQDMLSSMAHQSLEDLGVYRLPPVPGPVSGNILSR